MQTTNHAISQNSPDVIQATIDRLTQQLTNERMNMDTLDHVLLRDSINNEARYKCTMSRIKAGQNAIRLEKKIRAQKALLNEAKTHE